jgi:hypothetical protein
MRFQTGPRPRCRPPGGTRAAWANTSCSPGSSSAATSSARRVHRLLMFASCARPNTRHSHCAPRIQLQRRPGAAMGREGWLNESGLCCIARVVGFSADKPNSPILFVSNQQRHQCWPGCSICTKSLRASPHLQNGKQKVGESKLKNMTLLFLKWEGPRLCPEPARTGR